MTAEKAKPEKRPHPPAARDVRDGIPDRSANPAAWKYVLLAGVFLAWAAFLVWLAAE